MKKILTLLALIVLVIACTTTTQSTQAPVIPTEQPEAPVESQVVPETSVVEIPTEQEHIVEIRDFKFLPNTLTIKTGDSITWTNADGVSHTATGRSVPEDYNVELFATGKLAKGQSKTITLNIKGTYEYVCEYHPRMKGTIIVE